ncbi:hypothetical protein FRC06_002075 [Ceratobasidium sp. 370]|nr:hypothetical protein FRC06_002075 [Ceratobasidium sp. 370]
MSVPSATPLEPGVRTMSVLREGIKHLLKEAVPLPGISSLLQACDSGDSNTAHKEAAIMQHVEDLKKSLERLNAVDHARQVEFKDQLDRLVDDYRRNNTDTNRLSRLAKVASTLEALDNMSENITKSTHIYTVNSIGDQSERLESVDADLKSVKRNMEEHVSKGETQMSSILDMFKDLKGLLHQAAESLTSLIPSSTPEPRQISKLSARMQGPMHYCCYFATSISASWGPRRCAHPWGKAFRKHRMLNDYPLDPISFLSRHFPEYYTEVISLGRCKPIGTRTNRYPRADSNNVKISSTFNNTTSSPGQFGTLGQDSTGSPNNHGCTIPRNFDMSSMFSHQTNAIQVIAKCFRSMASSIRVDPDMPIYAWSHSCEPMAST